MLCIKKGQDRTKVLLSDALYPTCRASASNAVVTGRMLDEESKCSVFKTSRRCKRTIKVEGGRCSRIKYIPPTRSEQQVTYLWQGLILAVPKFVMVFRNLFLRKRPARISTFKWHEVGRIWAIKRAWTTVSERKGT
jgi:hypothetical protein